LAEAAIGQNGSTSEGDFPGPLFLAFPPVEMEWAQRIALVAASGANETVTYDDMLRAAGTGQFKRFYERFLFGSILEHLADRFGTKGSPIGTNTACASGGTAIQLGVEAIRRGECEAALCVGTDASINPESLIRFSLLSALSTRNDPPESAARPFSKDRDGFVMAEGGGALVIESLAHATARGAAVLGVLEGCGERADNFHRTRSSPDGKPIIACMQHALADAGIAPEQVDYINAHGTGTPENDKMEWLGVSAVFGERAGAIPISSNKSMIGHTLTAAGAVEAIFSLLAIRDQVAPPTLNLFEPSTPSVIDRVALESQPRRIKVALSNSFGFGGTNASILFRGV
jgi:3-oxoacyl-[acyl-carrier-protein] synthase II